MNKSLTLLFSLAPLVVIIDNLSMNIDPNQAFFDANILKFTDNTLQKDMLNGTKRSTGYDNFGSASQFYYFFLKLPKNLTCKRCVFQVSAWRFSAFSDSPVSTTDSEWCFQHSFSGKKDFSGRNSTCGKCGPIYVGKPNVVRNISLATNPVVWADGHSYEASTKFNTGKIVKTYKQGQRFTAVIHVRNTKN